MANEFNEYVRECFSASGEITIRPMMGGYLVYLNGKLIGDICGNELFLNGLRGFGESSITPLRFFLFGQFTSFVPYRCVKSSVVCTLKRGIKCPTVIRKVFTVRLCGE